MSTAMGDTGRVMNPGEGREGLGDGMGDETTWPPLRRCKGQHWLGGGVQEGWRG